MSEIKTRPMTNGFYDHLKKPKPEAEPEFQTSEDIAVPAGADIVVAVNVPAKVANRRNGSRYPIVPELVLRGRCGVFEAQVIDMSRSGVLLQITDSAYQFDLRDLKAFEERIAAHFGTGVCLQFDEPVKHVRGKTARVEQAGTVYRVAFQFRVPLQLHECHAFGLGLDDVETECAEEPEPFAQGEPSIAVATWSNWRE